MPNDAQYIKNILKIYFIMAWFTGLFILDTAIFFLVGRFIHSGNHDLLVPLLVFTLILLAQIPIQWKALRSWYPSNKRFYDALVVLITVIMAYVGLFMIIATLFLSFFLTGPHHEG